VAYPVVKATRLLVRELPAGEQPLQRLRSYGARAVSAAELIATVLQTPDALSLAEELLAHFGSLAELARASVEELCEFDGIGPAKACQLKAALELGRRLQQEATPTRLIVRGPADLAEHVQPWLGSLEQEHFVVALLTIKHALKDLITVYVGNVNSVMVRPAEVFQAAVKRNLPVVIILHNHPSNDSSPSPEDVRITRQLREAGRLLEVDLMDHLIISRDNWVSLKERGLGFD
jgi:DNA repair protein RadC